VTGKRVQPHIIDGEFQSDKYPTTPRGKVPLSTKDPTAQDLLWEYAQRRRAVDAEFADDLEFVLRAKGYMPPAPTHATDQNGGDPEIVKLFRERGSSGRFAVGQGGYVSNDEADSIVHYIDRQTSALWDSGEAADRLRKSLLGAERDLVSHGLKTLLSRTREIWGTDPLSLTDIIVRLSVNVGKLARLARGATKDQLEAKLHADALELAMGHVIVSMVRWTDDAGVRIGVAVERALGAQAKFARENKDR
jgi:hypothetical protein